MNTTAPTVTAATLAAFSDAWNRHDIDGADELHAPPTACSRPPPAPTPAARATSAPRRCARRSPPPGQTVPDAQWTNGRHFVHGDFGISRMDLHRHRRRRQPHRDRRRRPVHLQGRQDPREERVPQGAAQPACGPLAAARGRQHGDDRGSIRQRRERRRAALRPALRPAGRRRRRARGRDYAPTYWVATRRHAARGRRPDRAATSMPTSSSSARARPASSTALYLAQEHGIRAVVLEANQVAWGCSSRSGGQGQNASGRLKRSQWIERWGLDTAQAARRRDPRRLRELPRARRRQIDCDALRRRPPLPRAPRREAAGACADEARADARHFGYATRMLSADEVRRDYCDEREAAGAMLEAEGIGIHPLKMTYGLIAPARARSARRVHPAQPGAGLGNDQRRAPPAARRAAPCARGASAVCTGGYTAPGAAPAAEEPAHADPVELGGDAAADRCRAEGHATSARETFITDTRTLRFYYRLLHGQPAADRQPQRGDRRRRRRPGAPEAADRRDRAQVPAAGRHRDRLLVVGLGRREPRHDAAHRRSPTRRRSVWYALGYGGNGVSFSTWAGKRLAERIAGQDAGSDVFDLPIYDSPLQYPERARAGRVGSVRAVPPARPARALQVVLAARREAVSSGEHAETVATQRLARSVPRAKPASLALSSAGRWLLQPAAPIAYREPVLTHGECLIPESLSMSIQESLAATRVVVAATLAGREPAAVDARLAPKSRSAAARW